jgi:CRISPR-associated protein Csd1
MLHALTEYANLHGIQGEAGFTTKRIRWLLNFSSDGDYLGLIELNQPGAKPGVGKEFSNVPHLKFCGDTTMRQFLVDTAQFAVLLGEDDPSKKLLAKRGFYLRLLRDAGEVVPFLAKVASALEDERSRRMICDDLARQTPKAKPADNLTFAEIDAQGSRIMAEQDTWRDWWRGYFPTLLKKKKAANPMRCLVSGEMCEPAATHPKIKGIGGDIGGKVETSLVGFNLDPFCSYGLEQSSNAAMDAEQTEQYAAALNELIARHSYRLTGNKIVHWYSGKDEVPDQLDPFSFLTEQADTESDEADAQAVAGRLLDSIRTAKRQDILGYRFYATTLSGSSARVMVRDWMEGRFEDLVASIDAWFEDMAIVRRGGGGLAPKPKFLAVLGALVRELKDVPPPVEAKLWRVAVRKEQIPEFAMAQALARVKIDIMADTPMRHARIGLLKAYHIRKNREGGAEMKPYLNEDHPDAAYHCGRLMAIYADLQYAALGDVGAGVVQRFYAAASATPALILGRLSRGSQFHLNKLDGGLAHWYEQRLADVWGKIKDAPPKTLTLEEQSLFALGYYQQKAAPKKREEIDVATSPEGDES